MEVSLVPITSDMRVKIGMFHRRGPLSPMLSDDLWNVVSALIKYLLTLTHLKKLEKMIKSKWWLHIWKIMIILTRWSFSSSAAIIKMFEADSTKNVWEVDKCGGYIVTTLNITKRGVSSYPFHIYIWIDLLHFTEGYLLSN